MKRFRKRSGQVLPGEERSSSERPREVFREESGGSQLMGASRTWHGCEFGLVQAEWQVHPGEDKAPATLDSGQREQVRQLHLEQRKK